MAMAVLETERLVLRKLTVGDAAFIVALLNDPDWIRFIGDRGVRTLPQARHYIDPGLHAMYAKYGYGLWLVERRSDSKAMGMCGLMRREGLDHVDLGFASLPAFRGQGYTSEAAAATLKYAREVARLRRLVAITALDNHASIRVLERLGMRFESTLHLPNDREELKLFAIDWPQ
jgi:ribosomal-protein-alanine N-acetyltransferase